MIVLTRITKAHLHLMPLAAGLLVLSTLCDLARVPYEIQLLAALAMALAGGAVILRALGAGALAAVMASLMLFTLLGLWSLDLSYDGMHYHLPAAVEIADGRNIIYDQGGSRWSNIYPSGSWRLMGYAVAALTPLNPGVILNGLAAVTLFLLVLVLRERSDDRPLAPEALAFAFLVAFSPVVIGQLFSAMVDGLLCTLFLMLALLLVCRPHEVLGRRFTAVAIVALALLLGSVKSTTLLFLTVVFCGALIHELARGERARAAGTLRLGLVAAALVLLVNLRPYVTHLLEYGALLPQADRILANLMPKNVEDGSHLSNLLHLVFGATGPIECCDLPARLKIPFALSWEEILSADTDPRIGGFGPLFSGALVLAAALVLIYRPRQLTRRQQEFLVVAAISLGCVLLFPQAWWARLVPMLAPALVLAFAALSPQVPAAFRAAFLGVGLANGAIFAANAAQNEVWAYNRLQDEITAIREGCAAYPGSSPSGPRTQYEAARRYVLQGLGIEEPDIRTLPEPQAPEPLVASAGQIGMLVDLP